MKRILIVDDNIAILKQISAYLADDYDISLAKSGHLALQICSKEKPDLILLDVEMSGMDGFDVMNQLKRNPFLDRIPVIFLTANNTPEVEIRALESGARDFITKPVERSILLHRIGLHLRFVSYQAQTEQSVMTLSDSIATSFAEMIECRDENTGGHVMRTSRYVEALGNELIKQNLFAEELNPSALRLMVRAAPLHDIGKIAISDRILLKAERLDDVEFSMMKRHSEIGATILRRMYQRMPAQNYLRYASLIAGSHHERFDGKGYPQGFAGDNIPLCGRIMAVADVYDALMENRVYRKGMGHLQASNIIFENARTQFDPRIVEAFKAIQGHIVEIAKRHDERPSMYKNHSLEILKYESQEGASL
ncbi:MAG: response regulator [Treponema sp.]|jgi:putative two-component system response regulator|nr:response regulator [Treponema sp.]